MQFSNLITYDALYYKSTDAAAYYEAYGDIVGGIGSYPVLGNPHYHQSHDLLDTHQPPADHRGRENDRGDADAARLEPVATRGLQVDSFRNGAATSSWTPSPGKGMTGYIVTWGPADKPESQQLRVTTPSAVVKVGRGPSFR